MGVQSKALAVGARTITAIGGFVVMAHQATSNPMYGVLGVDLLRAGMSPQQALDHVVRADEGRENRQVRSSTCRVHGGVYRNSPQTGNATLRHGLLRAGQYPLRPRGVDAIAKSASPRRSSRGATCSRPSCGQRRGTAAPSIRLARRPSRSPGRGLRRSSVYLRVAPRRPLVELRA